MILNEWFSILLSFLILNFALFFSLEIPFPFSKVWAAQLADLTETETTRKVQDFKSRRLGMIGWDPKKSFPKIV